MLIFLEIRKYGHPCQWLVVLYCCKMACQSLSTLWVNGDASNDLCASLQLWMPSRKEKQYGDDVGAYKYEE